MPLLRKVAAKDPSGRPYTAPLGVGGSSQYIRMVYNSIEQGMMSAIAEAWGILNTSLGLTYDEVTDIFAGWTQTDSLRYCFLLEIGVDVCQKRDANGAHIWTECAIRWFRM